MLSVFADVSDLNYHNYDNMLHHLSKNLPNSNIKMVIIEPKKELKLTLGKRFPY